MCTIKRRWSQRRYFTFFTDSLVEMSPNTRNTIPWCLAVTNRFIHAVYVQHTCRITDVYQEKHEAQQPQSLLSAAVVQ